MTEKIIQQCQHWAWNKLRLDLDNSESRAGKAAVNVDKEVNNEAEVVTGNDFLNLEIQQINLHVPDIFEVGADIPSFSFSIIWKFFLYYTIITEYIWILSLRYV